MLPLWDMLQVGQINSPLGALWVSVSTLCVCGLSACLLFESPAMPPRSKQADLYNSGFKPYWLAEVIKFGLSCFPSHLLWGFISLRALHASLLILTLFCNCGSLSTVAVMTFSLPNCMSALPTLFHVASSVPLVVEFVLPVFGSVCGVCRMI